MRKWSLLGLTCGLAAALAFGLIDRTGKMPVQAEEPRAKGDGARGRKTRSGVHRRVQPRRRQGRGGFWTEDGDYVDQVGRHFKGRAAIEKLYKKVFAGQTGAKLAITVTSARLVTPDVAIEDGITEVTPPDGGPPTAAHFSAVLVKKDGVWYFESVRDTIAHPPSNAEHFEDLEWLIGHWKGEADKGESATASYTWAENKNFIVSSFATTLNGIPVVGGTQWIGWDAVDKRIRSWSFYSGGGTGRPFGRRTATSGSSNDGQDGRR
jgi:uncharacterized protein (TIGR02246 family)